jgi:hypothetical protein
VVNYASNVAQGRLNVTIPAASATSITLRDELNDILYVRDASELNNQGLYVELGPWGAHILNVGPASVDGLASGQHNGQ